MKKNEEDISTKTVLILLVLFLIVVVVSTWTILSTSELTPIIQEVSKWMMK